MWCFGGFLISNFILHFHISDYHCGTISWQWINFLVFKIYFLGQYVAKWKNETSALWDEYDSFGFNETMIIRQLKAFVLITSYVLFMDFIVEFYPEKCWEKATNFNNKLSDYCCHLHEPQAPTQTTIWLSKCSSNHWSVVIYFLI